MVKLNSQQDVINFVNMMGKTGCNADIKCGSIVVDACSILGVISLGLNKMLELVILNRISNSIELHKHFLEIFL